MQEILDHFIDEVKKNDLDVHFAQIWKGNCQEASYQSVSTKARLNLWSVSKGVVSCAAGIAEKEGLLDLNEKISEIFPEYMPDSPKGYLEKITLKHLLTMTSGLEKPLFFADSREFYEEKDWIQYFFRASFPYKPGSRWMYSNFNTYMVSCAIEKRAGMNLTEYLTPRFFTPLGIGNPVWTLCPKGHVHAANGLYLNIDELSAYGRMLRDEGWFNGKEIVPEVYLRRATVKQVENRSPEEKSNVCKGYGYGYQFHMNPEEGAFRGDGKYGQYCLVYPKEDVVVTIMSFTENTDMLEELIWKEIIPEIITENICS